MTPRHCPFVFLSAPAAPLLSVSYVSCLRSCLLSVFAGVSDGSKSIGLVMVVHCVSFKGPPNPPGIKIVLATRLFSFLFFFHFLTTCLSSPLIQKLAVPRKYCVLLHLQAFTLSNLFMKYSLYPPLSSLGYEKVYPSALIQISWTLWSPPQGRISTQLLRGTFQSVQFSRSIMSDSLPLHGLQHARLPCPSPTPRAYSNSCPSGW